MIVVTAPTGLVGPQILENLLDRDEPVRVIARDPNRLAAGVRERVEVYRDRTQTAMSSTRPSTAPTRSSGWCRRTHKLRGWRPSTWT
ncbi:MAG: hypothetical protein M3082_08425 [Candidatus Dormibacteraeota bacterium]|nr:hypothetical protein [Candidatus Dormibacteraeota bacterium]